MVFPAFLATSPPFENWPGSTGYACGRAAWHYYFVATFGGLLFGYDTGVINGAIDPMKTDLGLTPVTEGFVVSILIFGAALGAAIGGKLADRCGRRHNILVLAGVFIIGTIGCALAPT